MMLFVVLCGLLISGVTKLAFGAYPWQPPQYAVAQMRLEETRYAADLIAGKIKVPQKYIDEEKQKLNRQTKPSNGAGSK